jgi:hypothetical protein
MTHRTVLSATHFTRFGSLCNASVWASGSMTMGPSEKFWTLWIVHKIFVPPSIFVVPSVRTPQHRNSTGEIFYRPHFFLARSHPQPPCNKNVLRPQLLSKSGFLPWRWRVIMCKTVLLSFVHCLKYHIKLRSEGKLVVYFTTVTRLYSVEFPKVDSARGTGNIKGFLSSSSSWT